LLRQVHAALPPGGRVVIVDRPEPPGPPPAKSTFEALRSLHLLVSLGDVFPFSAEELRAWLADSGFQGTAMRPAGHGLVVVEASC
jgi:hypothetical protein